MTTDKGPARSPGGTGVEGEDPGLARSAGTITARQADERPELAPEPSRLAGAGHGGKVAAIVGRISQACGVVAAFMIMASVLITCQMIWVRGVLGQSSIWQTEAVIYLMIGATLIGLPYVQLLRGHVNVDLVPGMLPYRARRVLALFVLGLSALLALVIAWEGFWLFHIAWERGWNSDTVWGPPLWIPYLALPIGFGLYLLQLAVDLWVASRDPDAVRGAGGH